MNQLSLMAVAAALALVAIAGASPADATAVLPASLRAVGHADAPRGSDDQGERWLESPVAIDVAALFDRPASDWGPGHRGVDLWGTEGLVVNSPGSGVITFAGDIAGRGVVVVLHPSGLRSTLEPVATSVHVGDAVSSGQPVGALRLAGSHCAPRACLHWGVRRGGEYVDPLDVLRGYGPIRLLPLRQ